MNSNFPSIRFSEFKSAWKIRQIGDLLVDVSRPIKMEDDQIYQLVTVKRRNAGIVSRGYFKGADVLVKSQFIVRAGDYLISKRQIVHGANGIVPEHLSNSIVSNEYLVLHGTNDLNVEYLSIISKLPSMYKMFYLSSYGVDIEKLVFNVSDWKKRELAIPSIEEQAKITLFFNELDKLISLHQQELEALKQTKQGFLQKMFPKEGKIYPEIRFKEFSSPWKKYKLSDLATVTTGKAFKSTDFDKLGEYLVVTNKNIQDQENGESSVGDRINISNPDILAKYLLDGENILVTMDGVHIGKTGRFSNDRAVLAQRVGRINSDQFEFIYQVTKTQKFISKMNQISVGNAIKHISLQQIAEYSFTAPTEKEERMKIGLFLNNIDTNILMTEKKIQGLHLIKKGFLQKMFV